MMKRLRRGPVLVLFLSLLHPSAAQDVSLYPSTADSAADYSSADTIALTLREASLRMSRSNPSLQMAAQGVAVAENARCQASAHWWPTVQAGGSYVATSQALGVDFTVLHHTFTFPLLDSHTAGMGVTVTWPLFTGGQRLWGVKLARQGIAQARLGEEEAQSSLLSGLVTAYYALVLAGQVAEARRLSYLSLSRHYAEALRAKAEGMLTPSECLAARLARDEARREWEGDERRISVARKALLTLMGEEETLPLHPVSPLPEPAEPPAETFWTEQLEGGNITLQTLRLQILMARNRLRLARADYWPTVAWMGRQSLVSWHRPPSLFPHTVWGLGFRWTLFDGLQREARVRAARLARHTAQLAHTQAADDLRLQVARLASALQDAYARTRSLLTAVALGDELLRMRTRAFAEGMATSADVVDAEVMLAATRVALLTARYDYAVAWARLCLLTGRADLFWSSVGPSSTLTSSPV